MDKLTRYNHGNQNFMSDPHKLPDNIDFWVDDNVLQQNDIVVIAVGNN